MITVYGASDDLIEVEGDIREEFPVRDTDAGDLVAFSNATVLRIVYSEAGVWRITPVAGADCVTVTQAPEDDDDVYSDVAVVDADVVWVAHAVDIAHRSR